MAEAIPQFDSAADDSGMGADASVATESTERSAATPENGQPRAKANPEEKFQARYDKLTSQVGRLLSSPYLKSLGGDGIVRALEQFEAILSDPQTASSVKTGLIQTAEGRWVYKPASLQKASQVDADAGLGGGGEYEDPTVKALKSYLDERLNPLVERVTALQQRSDTALNAGGQQRIGDFTKRFLSEYPLSPEERAEFGEALASDIANLDPTMLLKMEYDQFRKRVALPNAEPFLPKALARKAQQRGSQIANLATDAGGPGSQGADTQPSRAKPLSWQQMQKATAAAALRAATESA